jgi:Tat protein secretion system quality control protein TatD with DNase activity
MRLIDAHTHLNSEPLVQDRETYIQKFVDAGGVGLVNAGADQIYNVK